MDIDLATIIGLVGVTLVLAVGKIFEPLREWLSGFTFRWNPLRWAGEMLSCTMCAGWWVGFGWGLFDDLGIVRAVVAGGLISVLSYVADESLAILAATGMRMIRGVGAGQPRAIEVPVPAPKRRPVVPDHEEPLSEEEAHGAIDEDERNEP